MHTVSLSWTASTDTVDGYNAYRGTASGQETTKLNTAPIVGVTFVDSSPLAIGVEAFYVVRAVRNGLESVNSNEATAVILPAAPTALTATVQ